MSSPISTAGSTGSSTEGHAAMASSRRSSRVSPAGPDLLRPGAITREAIESALGSPIDVDERVANGAERARAIGVALCAEGRASTRRRQRLGGRSRARFRRLAEAAARPSARLDLSPSGDLVEAASHLFSYLRALDAAGAARIAVAPIPATWAWRGDQRSAPSRGRARGTLRREGIAGSRIVPLSEAGLEMVRNFAGLPHGVGGDKRRPIVGI